MAGRRPFSQVTAHHRTERSHHDRPRHRRLRPPRPPYRPRPARPRRPRRARSSPPPATSTRSRTSPTCGVQVRRADYEDPASLDAAFAGVDRPLLVSSNAVGARLVQHRNVIEAATRAGVELLAYTSMLRADTSASASPPTTSPPRTCSRRADCRSRCCATAGTSRTTPRTPDPALATGQVIGAAGTGRISAATRQDFAEAPPSSSPAASTPAPSTSWPATRRSRWRSTPPPCRRDRARDRLHRPAGRRVRRRPESAGVPAPYAELLADSDLGVARGDLEDQSGDLARLIGRPTTRSPTRVARDRRLIGLSVPRSVAGCASRRSA